MRPIEVSWSSSAVRSCITRWARLVSFQRFGSSAWAFSSSSRLRALSTSKMPPQQPDGLLDIIDDGLDFGAHDGTRIGIEGEPNVRSGREQGIARPADWNLAAARGRARGP